MSYEMIWEARGVYRRYFGHTTDLEVSEGTHKIESSIHFDEVRYVILDFLEVTSFEVISPSFIEETAAIDSSAAKTNPNVKIAIVATDPGIIKLAEAYSAHELTPYPTQIYSNINDARDWVAVSLPLKSRSHKRA